MQNDIQTATNHLATLWYYGLRALVIVATLYFLVHGNWLNALSSAFILLLMLTPAFLRKKYDVYIPFELELAISSFVYVTLFLGSLNNYYERFAWWDALLHLQSGILLGTVGYVLIYILNETQTGRLTLSPFFVSFFAACFSIAMGVIWELYEFAVDNAFGFNMQRNGLQDTMHDLILNTTGAIVIALIGYIWTRWRLRVPFTPRRLAGSRYDRGEKKTA